MAEDFSPIPEGALSWKEPEQMREAKNEQKLKQDARANEEVKPGREILSVGDVAVEIPNIPWVPSHEGPEIRVRAKLSRGLLATDLLDYPEDMQQHLAVAGREAIIATKAAQAFAIDAPADSQRWHDAPWFNFNMNSHLGGVPFKEMTSQVYIRERRIQSGTEITSNLYWTVPIPVDAPLAPTDRQPYSAQRVAQITDKVKMEFAESGQEIGETEQEKLFVDEQTGQSSFESKYDFEIADHVNMVWEADGYMVFTGKNDALVAREDGMHLILISKYEQMAHKGEAERFSFFWQNPKMMAEMSIITSAIANIVVRSGIANEQYDKAYIHMNANWSLSHGLPPEERIADLEFGTIGTELDADGAPLKRKWPENPAGERALNVHPHIQILKKGHDLDLPPSGKSAGEQAPIRPSLTAEQAQELKALLDRELTPLLESMSGKSLKDLEPDS